MPASVEPTSRRDWQEIFALLDSALEHNDVVAKKEQFRAFLTASSLTRR